MMTPLSALTQDTPVTAQAKITKVSICYQHILSFANTAGITFAYSTIRSLETTRYLVAILAALMAPSTAFLACGLFFQQLDPVSSAPNRKISS